MWVVYSAIMAALEMRRPCPKCGAKQKVGMSSKGKPVTCQRCGHIIPPPKHKS